MSEDAQKVKQLISFKQRLEKRVEDLKSELAELEIAIEAVSNMLLEKGFKHAEIPKDTAIPEVFHAGEETVSKPSGMQFAQEYGNVIPLKTAGGDVLAMLYMHEDSVHVLPAEDKNFDINTPPFTHFLVERVLTKMQERDSELVKNGQLSVDRVFSYNIIREGDVIREIIIKHVDEDRLRELRSSIRWTLEKMYEKMKSQS